MLEQQVEQDHDPVSESRFALLASQQANETKRWGAEARKRL